MEWFRYWLAWRWYFEFHETFPGYVIFPPLPGQWSGPQTMLAA